MNFRKTIFTLCAINASFFALPNERNNDSKEVCTISYMQNIPQAIQKFSSLDFDGRMELQETMCQINESDDFDSIIAKCFLEDKNAKISVLNFDNCCDIVKFGRPLRTIDATKKPQEIAKECGFKRLSDFIQFYDIPTNKEKSFLEGKNVSFISALGTEKEFFKRILDLYDFDTKIKFWENWDKELQKYNGTADNDLVNIYLSDLRKKVRKKLTPSKTAFLKARKEKILN